MYFPALSLMPLFLAAATPAFSSLMNFRDLSTGEGEEAQNSFTKAGPSSVEPSSTTTSSASPKSCSATDLNVSSTKGRPL